MKLEDIVSEIFDIAVAIEYNNISYIHPLLASVKKQNKPDYLLLAVAAPLKQKITNHMPISKTEIAEALNSLKKIAKEYKIEELRKTTKDLQTYLDTLA